LYKAKAIIYYSKKEILPWIGEEKERERRNKPPPWEEDACMVVIVHMQRRGKKKAISFRSWGKRAVYHGRGGNRLKRGRR